MTSVDGVLRDKVFYLKLISAQLMEISEEWQIGEHYCAVKLFIC